MSAPPSSFSEPPRVVGDRVDDGFGSLGTVRYVGPVATAKDESAPYYGIEWDVWSRGKNDGSVELSSGERVVHFSGPPGRKICENGGQVSFKCSFVKVTTFDKTAERSSLLLRLQERYGNDKASDKVGGEADVMVAGEVGTTLGSEKPIEFVGAKKLRTQQTLQTIEKISLSGCQIADLGSMTSGQQLKTLAPNLTELDLSRNLFRSWSDLLPILHELPLLQTLILSGNRLIFDESDGREDVFENVKVLVLNQTLLPWNHVGKLVTRHFPKLEQLHLVENEYNDDDLVLFTPSGSWWETLSVLELSLNRFSSWKQMLEVIGRMFVNLNQLLLNSNCIVTLVADNAKDAFQKLTTLSMSDNRLDSWTSIDALNDFPLLDTFRLSKNPLTAQMSLGEARMLVIARSDNIAVFNASPVREKERKEAEQLYLKRILHELAVIDQDTKEQDRVLAAHPRYTHLRELYPEISIDQNNGGDGNGSLTGPRKLGSSLIKVSLIPMSMQATSFEPLVKKIPQQMKVSQLKLLIEAKLGVEVPSQVLSFRTDPRSMPMLLDDDNAEVSYYGMQDGSEVLINDNE